MSRRPTGWVLCPGWFAIRIANSVQRKLWVFYTSVATVATVALVTAAPAVLGEAMFPIPGNGNSWPPTCLGVPITAKVPAVRPPPTKNDIIRWTIFFH